LFHIELLNCMTRTGDRPIARSVPTHDITTHRNASIHPCLERDSNPLSQCSKEPKPHETTRIKLILYGNGAEFVNVLCITLHEHRFLVLQPPVRFLVSCIIIQAVEHLGWGISQLQDMCPYRKSV